MYWILKNGFYRKIPNNFRYRKPSTSQFFAFFSSKIGSSVPTFWDPLELWGTRSECTCVLCVPCVQQASVKLGGVRKAKKIAESIFRIIKCCGFEMSRHLCWTAWVWQPQTYQERKSHGVSTVTATMPVRSYVPFQWGTLMVAIGHELPKDNRSRDDETKYNSSKRRADSGLQCLTLFTIIASQ